MPAVSIKFSLCCPRILQGVLQSCNWETAVTSSTPALDYYAPGCGEITATAGAGQWTDRLPVMMPSNSCGIRTTASFPSVAICSALPLISYASCSPSPLLCRGLATTTDGVIAASNQVLSPGVMERLRGMQVTSYPNHHCYVFSASPISDDILYSIHFIILGTSLSVKPT